MTNLKENLGYDSILSTPLNQIMRYYPFVDFIKKLKRKNKQLKILEVGSGGAGITKFVKTPVVGMDVGIDDKPSPYLKFVKHSALKKFPFKNNEFDIVLSVDTYEHLPKNKRRKTLEEMYRVSRKYVLLTTLFGETKWDRKVLNNWTSEDKYYKDIFEHKKAGFPQEKEVYGFVNSNKRKIRRMKGVHPRLAYFFMLTEQNFFTMILSRTLLKLFLPVFKLYKGNNRLHFFITKIN